MAATLHTRAGRPGGPHHRGGKYTLATTGAYSNTTQTTAAVTIRSANATNTGLAEVTALLTLFKANGDAGQYVAVVAGAKSTALFPAPIYAPYGFKFRTTQGVGAAASGSVTWQDDID